MGGAGRASRLRGFAETKPGDPEITMCRHPKRRIERARETRAAIEKLTFNPDLGASRPYTDFTPGTY
jgi:hypothetical protein